jgi:protein-tyrosine phosphatase
MPADAPRPDAPQPDRGERTLRLQGAPNFRAIDALRAADGRRLRARRVFRSDALQRLTDDDVARVAGLGIGTVIDLRRPDEREAAPSRLPTPAPRTEVFDAAPALAAVQPIAWREVLRQPEFDAAAARAWMLDTYGRMPLPLATAVRAAARSLQAGDPQAGEAGPSILVHCTAGKDRTGFVCAMLLAAVDIPWDAIVDDYLESSRRHPPSALAASLFEDELLQRSARVRGALEVVASVQPEFLETACASARATFGSIDAYLDEACGLGPSQRDALRMRLLGD